VPLDPAPSFWCEADPGSPWANVSFEPGGTLSAPVAPPPSEAPVRAVAGEDGWLFDAREFAPRPAPTVADLEQIAAGLASLSAECAQLGITYVPAIIPCKRHVVTWGLGQGGGERAWVDGIVAHLRDRDDIEVLDLLGPLRDAARHGRGYNRTDADWNARGAFFAARALMKEAAKRNAELRPPAMADLHVSPAGGYRGVLSTATTFADVDGELVAIDLDAPAEEGVTVDAWSLQALRMPVEPVLAGAPEVHVRVYAHPDAEAPVRAAVVGDAACLPVVTWLAEKTQRTVFFWAPSPPIEQVELELPHVLLHLVHERELGLGRRDD
jgi:hypothetical protein